MDIKKQHKMEHTLNVRIPNFVYEKFRNKCDLEFKTMSDAIRDFIRDYIKEDK